MASKLTSVPAKHLFNGFRQYQARSKIAQIHPSRCMATEVQTPDIILSQSYIDAHLDPAPKEPILEYRFSRTSPAPPSTTTQPSQTLERPRNPFLTTAQCTLYDFPSLEPIRFIHYPSTHLLLPLRKDILHRAVIYEGDNKRAGTASTKWRSEVHGSNRKIRPQKGSGKARLGDKKSPMLRGGGQAFGPKPRDFGTDLPRKVYDLAWRTALSYRYKKGELIIAENEVEVDAPLHGRERYVTEMLRWHKMGRNDGRTLFVAAERRDALFDTLGTDRMEKEARALDVRDVDVKDLLETARLVIEREALEKIFVEHESDLAAAVKFGAWDRLLAASGQVDA